MANKPQKIFVVVCGDQERANGGKAHCSVCFGKEMAEKEKAQMKRLGYPIEGVFEVSAVNIFHREPYYLSGNSNDDQPSKVSIYI